MGQAPELALSFVSTPTKLRHSLSLLLPILMVVILPYWLLTSYSAADTRWQAGTPVRWIAGAAGVVMFAAGLALLSWCVRLFAQVGQGTLAPWDPTRNLVASGPYQYVRNPMISSVALMLAGEALFWGSVLMGIYLACFCAGQPSLFHPLRRAGLGASALASLIAATRRRCRAGFLLRAYHRDRQSPLRYLIKFSGSL